MDRDPVLELYNRFVKTDDMGKKLVLADDTDPGWEMTDHTESPWLCEAMGQKLWSHFIWVGEVVKVPFSSVGPVLVIYWLCDEPKTVVWDNGIGVEIPYGGRLAILFRKADQTMEMTVYRACIR